MKSRPSEPAITVRTLGPVDVQVKGRAAPPELLWRRPLALLVYLARSPRGTRTREHLVGLVWPDQPARAALHSLSEALRIIRKSGGKDVLATKGDQVQLAAGVVDLDVDRFAALTHAKRWADASALVAGTFLEGFAVPGSSGVEDWLRVERERWTREAVAALCAHAEQLLGAGAPDVALREARRAAELDPLADAAARAMIRALALTGQQADALQSYDRFAARVAEAVGAAPDPETTALAARVRRTRAPRAPAPAGPAPVRRPPLVGRTKELGQLLKAWERCRSTSRAAAGVILGDAGAGKTRLADEVAGRARLDGAVVAAARAVGADREEPWSALLALADGGLLDAPGVPVAPPAAVGALAARSPAWAERFPGAKRDGSVPLGRALRDVVRAACAEQPMVLMVDDAQWLDGESLLALQALLRDLAKQPCFVLLTATAHPARAELDELRSHLGRDVPGVACVLKTLARDDLLELARWALPGYDGPALERVTRRVATDSASLPLLAVELLEAVAAGLDLGGVGGGGAWPEPMRTLEQTMPGDFPDAVVGAIRVNFRRLSPGARTVLEALSALGERVPPATLGRTTGLSPEALHTALDELEWQRWVASDARGYSFVARVVGTIVARDMVTPGQSERLRARAAGK